MKQYLDYLRCILDQGQAKTDRTGTGTISVFGQQMRFNLQEGFPLVTSKKLHTRSIIHELLWFLRGDTNVRYLNENQVTIWDEWADAEGNLGPIYGKQWRAWNKPDGKTVDQIAEVVKLIKTDPDSRRLIVNAWNVGELSQMRMMPCHVLIQFYVIQGRLSCQLYQRSADSFLGVPFNIASYSLLTHMIAQQCELAVGDFIWSGGDCHIYTNHFDQVKLQLTRKPYALPELHIKRKPASIFEYQFDDFEIRNYQCHPIIRGEVAV